jgi:hypothetical protein
MHAHQVKVPSLRTHLLLIAAAAAARCNADHLLRALVAGAVTGGSSIVQHVQVHGDGGAAPAAAATAAAGYSWCCCVWVGLHTPNSRPSPLCADST